MTTRYALYAAPPAQDPLWRFGSAALGYDALDGSHPSLPEAAQSPLNWAALTQEPRRYGFHATIKAPFRLREGATKQDLITELDRYCRSRAPLPPFALTLTSLGTFLALVPAPDQPDHMLDALQALEADSVRHFDRFRAPLTQSERQRRLAAPLTPRQLGQLEAFGYPYIFADFRFHFSLTGSIADPAERAMAKAVLQQALQAPSPAPRFTLDALCLFEQAEAAAPFRLTHRFALKGQP